MQTLSLTKEEIKRLYGVLRSELNNFSVQNIRNTAAAAGIDVTKIPSKSEERSGSGSRAEVMPAVDKLFGELTEKAQVTALCIIAESLLREGAHFKESIHTLLGKHGYQFINGSFLPVDLLDQRESKFLPSTACSEIARATSRLVEDDYSGAITSSCGAVDLVIQQIYKKYTLGDPGKVSFQAKVNTAIKELKIFEIMEEELIDLDMSKEDVADLIREMKKATNHAAQALQILRRTMGDTHGSKPAVRRIAYDAIKWASAICGIFEGIDS